MKLTDYSSLSEVPLECEDVKFRCAEPRVICGDACGNNGCLALDHKNSECPLMREK